MRTSRLPLSLLAMTLVCSGLLAQDREFRRPLPQGDRRGSGSVSAEGRGGDRAQPMGGRIGTSEGQRGQSGTLSPMGRHLRSANTVVVRPRYIPRCTSQPTTRFWQHRDLFAEIQWMARRGVIPVTPVTDDITDLNGVSVFPAGWRAYGFLVPVGGKLHVRLHHGNEGWFRLAMVNKWGTLGAGMLQNLIPTGNPEVRYANPSKEAQAVYVIVDDPGWMSSAAYPFNLEVQRNWEPGAVDPKEVRMVEGIWASNHGISAEYARPHAQASFRVGARW